MSSTNITTGVFLPALLSMLFACNTYNPNLGETPFRCGTSDKRCPDDYQCVEYSDSEKLCEKIPDGNTPDAGPGTSGLACNADNAIEPNDTRNAAFTTMVADATDELSLVASICPYTDRDIFSVRIENTGDNLTVNLSYLIDFAPLSLKVTSTANETLEEGAVQSEDNEKVYKNALVANLPTGTYYVEVASAGTEPTQENNYDISFEVN